MNFKNIIMTFLVLLLTISPTYAGKDPRTGSTDARIKNLTYSENEVYRLQGHYGYTTVLEFSSKEKIETISIGDSEAWQVIKPNRQNILFIKPLEQNAETNMTILTSKRIYSFEMTASQIDSHQSSDLNFRIKFVYPNETDMDLANIGSSNNNNDHNPLLKGSPSEWNFDYTYSGSKRLRPSRVFDDGTFTYFQIGKLNSTPAIFSVDAGGNESLVNYNVQGQYIVVRSVRRQFTLRDGKTATCIFNENYPEPAGIQTSIAPIEVMEEREVAHNIPIPVPKPRKSNSGFSALLAFFDNKEFVPNNKNGMNE